MRLTTDGMVLGTLNMRDYDRIITILTEKQGVLRAYAGGARKPGSRLSGSTELLCYSRFVLFQNRDRCSVDGADLNRLFFGIRQDIEKLALASYLCELSAETSPEQEEACQQLRLLLNCLHMLETGRRTAPFIKPLFELRQIALAGYQPDLVACHLCGRYEGERDFRFYPVSGEIVCESCAASIGSSVTGGYAASAEPSAQGDGPREGRPVLLLPPPVLAGMRHILYAPFERLFGFSLAEDSLKTLGIVCERYIQAQLSRSFKTLDFYHSLCG